MSSVKVEIMRIAILMTNTDESEFSQAHPKDGQKFSELLWRVRPDWEFDIYSVKDDVFPKSLDFDGVLITGSPASVHDGAQWIHKLELLVLELEARKLPLFGACFGHQLIARALGAQVGLNPQGWVVGRIETQFLPDGPTTALYGVHKEQVLSQPEDTTVVARTGGCSIAGFSRGHHILTTQYHPEMTPEFINALIHEFTTDFGEDVTAQALSTLNQTTNMNDLATWIADFFEAGALGSDGNFTHI